MINKCNNFRRMEVYPKKLDDTHHTDHALRA